MENASTTWFTNLAEMVQISCGAETVELVVRSVPELVAFRSSRAHDAATGFSVATWVEPQIIDLRTQERTAPIASWVASAVVVPVVSPQADLGWLIAAASEPDVFDASTLQLLARAAGLAEGHLDSQVESLELDRLSELLHQSQVALKETQGRLEVSNQELEQFAYIAAHELVAPLRSVAVYAEVLATLAATESEQSEQSEQLANCVTEVRTGVQTMTEQVQYLLTLSRANQNLGNLNVVDVAQVAWSAVDTLAELIDESETTITIDALPAVMAQEIPLQSVFANLLTNAIRYRDLSRLLEVRIDGAVTGDRVNIEVHDNASGISPDAQQRIFSLFERGTTEADGLGVGLAVSRRILEGFGATISVRSSEAGSTFVLEFPLPRHGSG